MRRICLLCVPLLLACTPQTADKRVNEDDPEGSVSITPDELKPLREFVITTNRVVVAEFVRIEMSRQFFEQQMGFSRDPLSVARSPVTVLKDGTRTVTLKNLNTEQQSNIDPGKLPRVYFGEAGLEVRAYREIRIYMRTKVDKERPLFISVQAKNATGDAKLWVSGRLQHKKPSLRVDSALLWSEQKERYVHKASSG